jgi:hypothetical protein
MPTRPARFETHSKLALVTFCLPVGLLSYWIFQRLLKTCLVSVLPDQAYMRWRPYAAPAAWGSARQWLLAGCGVLGGAVVHLAWDAFTHEDGRGVRMVPELSDPLLNVHDHLVTGAILLQGLSSLVGLVIVMAAIGFALRGSGHSEVTPRLLTHVERRNWTLLFVLVTLSLCVGFFALDHIYGAPYHRWIGLGSWAVAFLRALVVAAVLVSLPMQAYLRAKR